MTADDVRDSPFVPMDRATADGRVEDRSGVRRAFMSSAIE